MALMGVAGRCGVVMIQPPSGTTTSRSMLIFSSHLPIPQLSVKNQIIPPAKSLVRSHFDSVSSHKTGKEGQYIDVRPECSDKVRCAISMRL